MIVNQSLRLFPDPPRSASTDVALFSKYQLFESFVCWEHGVFEKALPTMLGLQGFLLLSKYSYNCEFSVLPWSAPNLYPGSNAGKMRGVFKFHAQVQLQEQVNALQLYSGLFCLQLESLEPQKSMSYCSVISFCVFLCALEGEYSFALLFEMHYLVIIHLLAQDKDMVWH